MMTKKHANSQEIIMKQKIMFGAMYYSFLVFKEKTKKYFISQTKKNKNRQKIEKKATTPNQDFINKCFIFRSAVSE